MPLLDYQEVDVAFFAQAQEVLLGNEMGLGKTISALRALHLTNAFPAIVICPNSVKTSWANEMRRWLPEATPYIIMGGAVGRKKIITAAAKDPNAVVIVNYESARLLTRLAPYGSTALRRCRECDKRNGEEGLKATQCHVHPKELNKIRFKTVIIDEAHKIKNPQSQQTRAVWAITDMPSVTYRWLMTGTPIANHPGDLWSLLHAMSPREFPTKTHFVDRYCLQSWNAFGGLDIVGLNPANRDEFYKIFDPHFRRMPKDLVLSQLPHKVRSVRWVEMTPAQRRSYNDLEKGLATMTEGGVLVVADPLIARLRRLQLASSQVTVTPGPDPSDLSKWLVQLVEPSPKLDALEEVLAELGDKPVVIAAEHRKLIELAARRLDKLKISYGLITGVISEYERDLALRRFQEGKLRVLMFTVKAGGVGLTMTAADTIVFLQRSDSMIDNKQAEDRVHRIGSEIHESINVIDIVSMDTIEEGQIKRLHEKFMRLQEITRDRLTLAQGSTTGFEVAIKSLDEEEALILSSSEL